MDGFKAYRLGIVDYPKALKLQLSLLEKRMKEEIEDVVLLLEHPPTFTMGRSGKNEHLLMNLEELKKRGIHFEEISRGGDITYHGPGQLVGYPILDLNKFNRDIHRYTRNIEEMVILALSDFKIKAERIKGLTGVWVSGSPTTLPLDPRLDRGYPRPRGEKIASIGVGIKRWITYHGFALNVNTDLSYFDMIVPCGIPGAKMTSMKKVLEKKENIKMTDVEASIINAFSKVFNRKLNDEIKLDDISLIY
jgi:lipoyl(octanoyl) transferase